MNTPLDRRSSRPFWFLKGIKVAVLMILFVGVLSWLFMLLWNWLVPEIFGLKPLDYGHALGLLVLCRIMFGGRGGWGHGHGRHPHWKHRMHNRWKRMTPEEREKFRSAMREKWCWRERWHRDQR